ncbi:MAG: hypothetical protein H6926_04180 [Chromatiales bacterium]|nr:hypothetical protein [Gammaproteobacteria bacterium]MCP5352373.1 hypothetical protein [Chromatiales bacterium]
MNTTTHVPSAELHTRWCRLISERPYLGTADAARALGVSHAELVSTRCGQGVVRLRPDWPALFRALAAVGTVTMQTRNECAVHTVTGAFPPHPGWHVRPHAEGWQHALATLGAGFGLRDGIGVFDGHGRLTHEIQLTALSDDKAFRALIEALRATDQTRLRLPAPLPTVRAPTAPPPRRRQPDCASAPIIVPVRTAFHVLTHFTQRHLPIRLVVPGTGTTQTRSGLIAGVIEAGPWLNVLGDGFRLHLRERDVSEARYAASSGDCPVAPTLTLFDRHAEPVLILRACNPCTHEEFHWGTLRARLDHACAA